MTNENIKKLTKEINNNTSEDIVSVSYGLKIVDGKLTDEKSVIYTVKEKKPLSEIPEKDLIPKKLTIDGEEISTDVIEGIIKPHGYALCESDFYEWMSIPPSNRNQFRPLKGGVSTTNLTALSNYVGTLGFIAVDNDTNSLVAVSNNHVYVQDAFFTSERNPLGVLTDSFTETGHTISQPNEVGNSGVQNKIGILKKYQPLDIQNDIDVAVCAIDDLSLIDVNESWKQEGITGMTSPPRFATTQEIDDLLNDSRTQYYSAGRTTGAKGEGVTKLLNYASNSSIYISYNLQGNDQPIYMNDTFELIASGSTTPQGDMCYYPSYGGDSGSAVLSIINGEWVIVGIIYGGRYVYNSNDPLGEGISPVQTLCCRIDNIANSLNISAWDGTLNNINNSDNINPEIYVISGTTSDKSIEVSGNTYWQMGLVDSVNYPANIEPSPTPSTSVTPTPTVSNTQTPTPTVTPTPTTSQIIGSRVVGPAEAYPALMNECNGNNVASGISIGINVDYYDNEISGSVLTYFYSGYSPNEVCYVLYAVDTSQGTFPAEDFDIYIASNELFTETCCVEPTVTTTVTNTATNTPTPLPPTGTEDPTNCTTYELINNGNTVGVVEYIPCSGETSTINVQPDGIPVYICSENVPSFTNQGYQEFGIVKNNFVISGTDPVYAIFDYNNTQGTVPDNVDIILQSGQITFNQPIGETSTTFGPVTFRIEGNLFCNSLIGGCGSVDVYIFNEGLGSLTNIGSINITANQTTTFSQTHTFNSLEYGTYSMVFVSPNNAITYGELNFIVEQSVININITSESLGSCNDVIDCDSFIINHEVGGGCGSSTTYTVTISNISTTGGPYTFSLDSTGENIESSGEDVIFTGVTSGVRSVIFNDISGVCDRITRQFYLPVISEPTVTLENIVNPLCFNCDGEVNLNYNGFVAPITIQVYSGLTASPNVLVYEFTGITDTSVYNITGLCGGVTYRFQVTGSGGCTNKVIDTIPSTTAVSPIFYAVISNSDCGIRDSITISVQNNGLPITYYVTSQSNPNDGYSHLTTNSSHTFYNLPSDTYDVGFITTDNPACTYEFTPITIINPDMYNITTSNVVDSGCGENQGSFTINVQNGESVVNYPIDILVTYNVNNDVVFQTIDSNDNSFIVNNLIAGDYTITLTDKAGCEQILTQSIDSGGSLDFSVFGSCDEPNNGTAGIIINSSEGTVSILWVETQETTETINGLSSGVYNVTVSDDNCTITKSVFITCPPSPLSGESQTAICENTFEELPSGENSFQILTNMAFNDQYPSYDDNCNYIPEYVLNLVITNINGFSDINVSELIYTGVNIDDVLTDDIWVNSVSGVLSNLVNDYDFISFAYIDNGNFIIESNSGSDVLDNASVNLSVNITINESC